MCVIVIQGTIEAGGKLTKAEIAQSINFCSNVIAKVESSSRSNATCDDTNPVDDRGAAAPAGGDERCDAAIMGIVRTNRVLDLDDFAGDVINGMAPNMERDHLGLVMVKAAA